MNRRNRKRACPENDLSDSDSELSSLFSSNGESEYNPSSDDNYTSDESEDDVVSDVCRALGIPNAPIVGVGTVLDQPVDTNVDIAPDLPNDPNVEIDPPGDLENDPNVRMVVDAVHNQHGNAQGVWQNTNTIPPALNFTGQEQINLQATTPIEVYESIFDNALLDKIVFWINKRAEVVRGTPLPKHSSLNKWTDISKDELKKFLGLTMLMGNLGYPSLKHFWSKDPLYEHPLFGRTMPRNRYESILKCLCFYNAETDQTTHKLHKIDQVLKHILDNCNSIYNPGQSLSLDEAMVLFRGRLSFRQYIKNKAHKYGVKLYELCTSDGFILNIIIYEGKGTLTDQQKGHSYEVVKKLMANFVGKGHVVYLDNFYNSVALAEDLFNNQTAMCGTLQAKRSGNPLEVTEAKLKKGETVSRQKGNVTVMKWRDKRHVLTISTTNGPEMEEVVNKRGTMTTKPSMVVAYNKGMSGIDRSDQMISYYSTPRKSLRWYVKIFFHLVDVALWNSTYISCKLLRKITYLEFRDLVIRSYLAIEPVRRPVRVNTPSSSVSHLPTKFEKRLRCYICRTVNKKRTDTYFACSVCKDLKNKPIGLCMPVCFNSFHQK